MRWSSLGVQRWATLRREDEWWVVRKYGIAGYVLPSFTRRQLKIPKTEASTRGVPLQARALEALDRITDGNGSPQPPRSPANSGGRRKSQPASRLKTKATSKQEES